MPIIPGQKLIILEERGLRIVKHNVIVLELSNDTLRVRREEPKALTEAQLKVELEEVLSRPHWIQTMPQLETPRGGSDDDDFRPITLHSLMGLLEPLAFSEPKTRKLLGKFLRGWGYKEAHPNYVYKGQRVHPWIKAASWVDYTRAACEGKYGPERRDYWLRYFGRFSSNRLLEAQNPR